MENNNKKKLKEYEVTLKVIAYYYPTVKATSKREAKRQVANREFRNMDAFEDELAGYDPFWGYKVESVEESGGRES